MGHAVIGKQSTTEWSDAGDGEACFPVTACPEDAIVCNDNKK